MLRACTGLAEPDLAAIADLERRVVAHDGGRLKLAWPTLAQRAEQETNDLLWWEGAELVGFVGIYPFGSVPELAGMVDPRWRRQGVGSALLAAASAELAGRGAGTALLVCPRTGAGGVEFGRARGGVEDHSEHALALTGPPAAAPADPRVTLRAVRPGDLDAVVELLRAGFGHAVDDLDDGSEHVIVERDGELVGYLRTLFDAGAQRGDVYGFVVRADLRGQGIGRDVLHRTCSDLIARGAQVVGLEVESRNDHTLGLYMSLGFRPVVTEDYLRLTVAG